MSSRVCFYSCSAFSPGGETGRRTGLKIPSSERNVPVQFRSRAPSNSSAYLGSVNSCVHRLGLGSTDSIMRTGRYTRGLGSSSIAAGKFIRQSETISYGNGLRLPSFNSSSLGSAGPVEGCISVCLEIVKTELAPLGALRDLMEAEDGQVRKNEARLGSRPCSVPYWNNVTTPASIWFACFRAAIPVCCRMLYFDRFAVACPMSADMMLFSALVRF